MMSYMYEIPRWENATLEKYFNEVVTVKREKTKAIKGNALPNIKRLLQCVHHQDNHFEKDPVPVGSYTQGLGVNAKRDYDFSIVFHYDPTKESNALRWTSDHRIVKPNYDFDREFMKDRSAFEQGVKIVNTPYYLSCPGPGYCLVSMNGHSRYFSDLLVAADLIPFCVQRKFRALLQNAIEKVNSDVNLQLSEKFHGPAIKVETKVRTGDGEVHPVSIDLAVIIRAELPFLSEMRWPVPNSKWPSKEKVQAIREKGINVVAKKEFFWQLSFAELEKLLVKEIDKDGGCRKKMHRIMKSVLYTVCDDKDKPIISTYILKNVWFHECEKFPDEFQWSSDSLSERYESCLQSLIECSRNGVLCQYFDRRVNLLEGKYIAPDVAKISNFDFTQWQPTCSRFY